jgi:hypothetical protein
MAIRFTASKNSVYFELLVNGTIEVKPVHHNCFSEETIKVLAAAHQVFIRLYLIKNRKQDLVELAVDYFAKHGFEVRER